jgi:hypothetical protein
MSVTNGQQANADTFNTAFVSKTTDSTVTGKVELSNASSGATVENVQLKLNEVDSRSATNQSTISTHVLETAAHGTAGNIVGESDTQVLTNKTLDADLNTLSNISNEEVAADADISWDKLATGTVNSIIQTNASTGLLEPVADVPSTNEFLKFNGTTYVWDEAVGGGAADMFGSFNKVLNFGLEDGTITGWNAYNDGPTAVPVNTTGGSVDPGFTISSSTVSLRGSRALRLDKPASNVQGHGITYDFEVDNFDQTSGVKNYYFSFESGYTSTTPTTLDVIGVFVRAGNGVISEAEVYTQALPTRKHRFYGSFGITSSGTYKLILHVKSTNSDNQVFYFDSFYVGPYNPFVRCADEAYFVESNTVTSPATNAYLFLTGNVIELTPGFWSLTAGSGFEATSSSVTMLVAAVHLSEVNGSNTSTVPTPIGTSTGITVYGSSSRSVYPSPGNLRFWNVNLTTLVDVKIQSYLVYAVPRIAYSSGTSHTASTSIAAVRLK